ncbi:MAG: Hpt domain-containing protein [Desulfobacteraceae bacterium]|nr:MAG: Hpt domain-containing protein [Desulfobacteraceae bacterium]
MSEDTPIIDIDSALNRALGDVAFLQMMFDEFQQMLPETMAGMSEAVTGGDMQRLAMDAHQLKGAAANLGAMALASAALTLEKIVKSGDHAGVREAFERIQAAVDHFKQHLSLINWSCLGENSPA